MTKRKIKIGALISGGGTNLQAIIDACENGQIDGEMVFVGSDVPDVKGLERAKKHGIPTFVVNYSQTIAWHKAGKIDNDIPADFNLREMFGKQGFFDLKKVDETVVRKFFESRAIAEAELLKEIGKYDCDLLVLAGFMRNLTPYFIDRFNLDPEKPRIMNIHPALLPAFPGVDGYGDTFAYGCKIGGCTVHFIDYGEDSGPIIGQRAYPIHPSDLLTDIKERGLKLEWELYPECIQLFAENRLIVTTNKQGRKIVLIGEIHNFPASYPVTGVGGRNRDIVVENTNEESKGG